MQPSPTAQLGSKHADTGPTSQPGDAAEQEEKKKAPTLGESWDKILKEVMKYDEDLVKAWRDDIDTLLVFAGLFSAVVTALLLNLALLLQISLQLNASQVIPLERPPFQADSSSIRINCFWFLSLIFSLTSALFGLLCKQWIREHQRDTQTRTPGEALALRQLRRDSFEKWGVSSFLSALPILLEVALLLFFVGVLDLLWNRHRIPFALCFVAVTFSAGLYFVTTFLPTLTVPRDQTPTIRDARFEQLKYQFICPYKSPQAWAVYHLSCKVINLFHRFPRIRRLIRRRFTRSQSRFGHAASDWSSSDLRVVRGFDEHPVPYSDSNPFNLKVYELRAIRWTITTFRDSPSMMPHLRNVLVALPHPLAMFAMFDEWMSTMWVEPLKSDVELSLKDPGIFAASKWDGLDRYIKLSPIPSIRYPVLECPEGLGLLFCHQYWMSLASRVEHVGFYLKVLFASIQSQQVGLQQSTGLRFIIPFPVVEKLWTHANPDVRKESLRLLSFFEEAWKPHPGRQEREHDLERIVLVVVLARHLCRTDCTSELLTSRRGQGFIRFVHEQIISRRLYKPYRAGDSYRRHALKLEWIKAIQRAREIGNLPSDYFALIPHRVAEPPAAFRALDSADVRYSIETAFSALSHFDAPNVEDETNNSSSGNEIADIGPNSDLTDNCQHDDIARSVAD
ncbi:hypothetical protein Moror_17100 [Moniliophthora roreri MCA 2997]|uniref:DUF6535 domain-containing protein n=1 Tax=Moniliophthora roreri (strain MCA 2997) TaxID=1381753 RepID=V2X4T2_MONRO|nr:hypothetical protein Moror_17100 [Moniliophthora roreri MCA 2997]